MRRVVGSDSDERGKAQWLGVQEEKSAIFVWGGVSGVIIWYSGLVWTCTMHKWPLVIHWQ